MNTKAPKIAHRATTGYMPMSALHAFNDKNRYKMTPAVVSTVQVQMYTKSLVIPEPS